MTILPVGFARCQINDAVDYDGYVLKRMANGPIEVEQDEQPVTPVMPVLRKLAQKLGISTLYEGGTEANTQQLGKRVIAAIQSL